MIGTFGLNVDVVRECVSWCVCVCVCVCVRARAHAQPTCKNVYGSIFLGKQAHLMLHVPVYRCKYLCMYM